MKRSAIHSDYDTKRVKLSHSWSNCDIERAVREFGSSCEEINVNEIPVDTNIDDSPWFMSHGLKYDKETSKWDLVNLSSGDTKGELFGIKHSGNDVLRILVLGLDGPSIASKEDVTEMLKTSSFYAMSGKTFCYAARRLRDEDDDEDDVDDVDPHKWLHAICGSCEFSWEGCPQEISKITDGEYYTQLQPLTLKNTEDVFNAACKDGFDFVDENPMKIPWIPMDSQGNHK